MFLGAKSGAGEATTLGGRVRPGSTSSSIKRNAARNRWSILDVGVIFTRMFTAMCVMRPAR
jgi:hypothetical protein